MDHRSGSASQGTSPLKAAGFLVGLLVVVALAFALGMKAGRELDVLRPERGGETVKLGEVKGETKAGSESAAPARREEPATKRPEPAALRGAGAELAESRRDPSAPAAQQAGERGASAAAGAPVGDEPPAASAAPAPAATSTATVSSVDYGIFRSAPGAAGGAKPTSPGSSLDQPAAPGGGAKPSAAKPAEPPKTAKPEAAATEPKVAAVKPAPKPAAAAPPPGKLKITPEAEATAEKASPGFVVQVAALQSKSDAEQLATRVRAHGAAPYINKVELPNGTWYRVRVGKFKTTAEAKAAQKKLAAAGFRGAEVMSAR